MKTFYRMDNIGEAKYTISYHDGIEKCQDGSPIITGKHTRQAKHNFNIFSAN